MFAVEDGSIVTGANSYVPVAYADTYNTDRATAWTGTDGEKEAALIKATDYLEQVYQGRWIGDPLSDTQALSWPRIDDIIPDRLKQAVCILALEAITADLNPVQDRAVKREKVDVIEVEYMDNAKAGKTRPAIDGLLRALLTGFGMNAKAVRV